VLSIQEKISKIDSKTAIKKDFLLIELTALLSYHDLAKSKNSF